MKKKNELYYGDYFAPTNYNANIPECNGKWLSDKLYNAIRKQQLEVLGAASTPWIYLMDCVDRQTITPKEAWQCVHLGYIMENLKFRPSIYKC